MDYQSSQYVFLTHCLFPTENTECLMLEQRRNILELLEDNLVEILFGLFFKNFFLKKRKNPHLFTCFPFITAFCKKKKRRKRKLIFSVIILCYYMLQWHWLASVKPPGYLGKYYHVCVDGRISECSNRCFLTDFISMWMWLFTCFVEFCLWFSYRHKDQWGKKVNM